VAGRPSKVIAHNLGISIRTVEVRRARMLERLGTRRLAGAIRLAVWPTWRLTAHVWQRPTLRLPATDQELARVFELWQLF
jgi:hypothetical protein